MKLYLDHTNVPTFAMLFVEPYQLLYRGETKTGVICTILENIAIIITHTWPAVQSQLIGIRNKLYI